MSETTSGGTSVMGTTGTTTTATTTAADALTALRSREGLTQDEMAAKLFVTRQAVSRWETGETIPSTDTLKLIAQEFHVSIDDLLGQPQERFCQSCSMPLASFDELGSEKDGGASTEYCVYCYKDGAFTHDRTIDEMVEHNLHFLDEFNSQNGSTFSEEEARAVLRAHLTTLKRWKSTTRATEAAEAVGR